MVPVPPVFIWQDVGIQTHRRRLFCLLLRHFFRLPVTLIISYLPHSYYLLFTLLSSFYSAAPFTPSSVSLTVVPQVSFSYPFFISLNPSKPAKNNILLFSPKFHQFFNYVREIQIRWNFSETFFGFKERAFQCTKIVYLIYAIFLKLKESIGFFKIIYRSGNNLNKILNFLTVRRTFLDVFLQTKSTRIHEQL